MTARAVENLAQSLKTRAGGRSTAPLFLGSAGDLDLGGEFQLFTDFYFHAQYFALPPTTSDVVWVKKV